VRRKLVHVSATIQYGLYGGRITILSPEEVELEDEGGSELLDELFELDDDDVFLDDDDILVNGELEHPELCDELDLVEEDDEDMPPFHIG
jgi:hypothetical protein